MIAEMAMTDPLIRAPDTICAQRFIFHRLRCVMYVVVVAVVASHCTVSILSALSDSPTWDEIGHLPAGVSHWQLGRFELYAVNPPLVRSVAAIPLVVCGVDIPWETVDFVPGHRSEWNAGSDFIRVAPERAMFWFAVARWFSLPFSLLGAYICFRWANELYGRTAGIVALVLLCFSPTVLAYGHLITPDTGAATMGVTAAYGFWRWLKTPTWDWTCGAGLLLGLAELTKTTWIVLLPLWIAVWLTWRCAGRSKPSPNAPLQDGERVLKVLRREAVRIVSVLGIAICVINLGYGFEGSFEPLGKYQFVSKAFRGPSNSADALSPEFGNRFAGTWLGSIPVPLPMHYLLGIDLQKRDFENRMWSYLHGEWRLGGWWYYYLYALAIKEPLGTWLLVALAAGATVAEAWRNRRSALLASKKRRDITPSSAVPLPEVKRATPSVPLPNGEGSCYSASWRNEFVLLAPAVAVLVFVSSQTGFNHHVRYVLPALPFIFIWASKVARCVELRNWKIAALAGTAITWSVVSSLSVSPHSLSYFNELAGGPLGGHYHLGNSNADWGQDLMNLKRWLDVHSEARPITLAYDLPLVDPKTVGIEYTDKPPTDGPKPGWHAVSVNQIHRHEGDYLYFLEFQPVGMAGYSIYIYHLSQEDVDRFYREGKRTGVSHE